MVHDLLYLCGFIEQADLFYKRKAKLTVLV